MNFTVAQVKDLHTLYLHPHHWIPSLDQMGGPYVSNSKGSQQVSQATESISAVNVEIQCDHNSVLPPLCVLSGLMSLTPPLR